MRPVPSRAEALKTEEKVVAGGGEAGWLGGPGLLDAVGRRNEEAGTGLEVKFVDRGGRPRRGGCWEDIAHAVGCARAALEAEVFSEPEAVKD